MELAARFGAKTPVVGMVHLPALPGAPGYGGDFEAVREAARRDATALVEGGVDAVMVENFGDVPFYPDDVPDHVVASMSVLLSDVRRAVDCPLGVNVLRNDATAALSIAAAVGASFVRVNVHTGARVTDQGLIEGRAHETIRLRERLDADVAVLADVDVKHSAPLGEGSFAQAFADVVERGRADAVVVSGAGTGAAVDTDRLAEAVAVRRTLDESPPILVGSGATPENVGDLLETADGVIVGTALKVDRRTTNPVDPENVASLVEAVRG